ncbi:MAG: 3-phosphoshikimate 1-carboxyvinyltransferase [Actinomycetota bacterium]
MRIRITPGSSLSGELTVPGDKSIAHRWLILSSTARGNSEIRGLPKSLDVRSMASCLAAAVPAARPGLEAWAGNGGPGPEPGGSTWNAATPQPSSRPLEVQGEGREGMSTASRSLDCGNSGTAMRLLVGLLAGAPFTSVLVGDPSLSTRPMERVAEPLRAMGASVSTTDGHAPMEVLGGALRGVGYRTPVPTAQVKGAILLAGLVAEGLTTVEEPAPTRDHTERALRALGAPIRISGRTVSVSAFQHAGFAGAVPGDPSSAAFIVAAAALTGSEVTVTGVGLNPSRLHFLDVMTRMGVRTETTVTHETVGEPVGDIWVSPGATLAGTTITENEIPLLIDEIPVLASLAAHAPQDTWFIHAAELRFKESDRLAGIADGLRNLGGSAGAEGDDLVIAGGGLRGGRARSFGDHRMAMAFAVAALAASGPSDIEGMEAADVSFPGFVEAIARLGARVVVS